MVTLKDLKVGDLIIVHTACTNSSQLVIINEIDAEQKHIVYSVSPGHDSWARFNQLELIPGQENYIPELKLVMNGLFYVRTQGIGV